MLNLNEKYFSISERCGRNHQNKFCLRPLKGRLGPWELKPKKSDFYKFILYMILSIFHENSHDRNSQLQENSEIHMLHSYDM